MGKRALAWIMVLCAAGFMPTGASTAQGAGAENWPTFHPATLPTLDSVVKLPRISIKTQGLTAKEAFELLSRETGVSIISRVWKEETVMPGHNPGEKDREVEFEKDVWNTAVKGRLNFDIENASFWEAACRIADYAGVGIEEVIGETVVLGKRVQEGKYSAVFRCFTENATVVTVLERTVTLDENEKLEETDPGRIENKIVFLMTRDPRVILSMDVIGKMTLEELVDNKGRPILRGRRESSIQKDDAEKPLENKGIAYFEYGGINQAECNVGLKETFGCQISRLRGNFEIRIPMDIQEVGMPMDQLGFVRQAGDWQVKLENFSYSHRKGVNGVETVLLGLTRRGDALNDIMTLNGLVRAYDERGVGIPIQGNGMTKKTVKGGVLQNIYLDYETEQLRTMPAAKMKVYLPGRIEKGVVPFDLKKMNWPEVKIRRMKTVVDIPPIPLLEKEMKNE